MNEFVWMYICTVNNEEKDGKNEEFKNNKTYLGVPYFNLIFMWPMRYIWIVGHNDLDF